MSMGRDRLRWVSGDHNVICDLSGFEVKRSDCLKRWDGLLVRRQDWEPRHPQDFLRVKPDRIRVADPRPDIDRFEAQPVTADDL